LAILKVLWLRKISLKSLALSLAFFEDGKNLFWRFFKIKISLFQGILALLLGFLGDFSLIFTHFYPIWRNKKVNKQKKSHQLKKW